MKQNSDVEVEFSLSIVAKWPEPMLLMEGERFVEANPAAVALLGHSDKSALLQHSFGDLSPSRQPDGKLSASKARGLIKRLGRQKVLRFEWVYLAAGGNEVSVDVSLTAMQSGERQITLCAWHDIGAQKRAQNAQAARQAYYQSFFDHNAAAMLVIDPPSGRIVDANHAAAAYYGYTQTQLIGLPASKLSALPLEGWDSAVQAGLSVGEHRYCSEHRLASTAVRDVEVCVSKICHGKTEHLLAIVQDVTDRRREEKAFRQANAALARSNLELKHFAQVAAHDLQTPLRTISAFTRLLHEETLNQLSERARQWSDLVLDGSRRMQTLIDDLLSYSQLDLPLRSRQVADLRQVFEEARTNLAGRIEERGAEVLCGDLPLVRADRTQMIQVLQNLIENGIKYNTSATPRVALSARREGGTWLLSVADNGIGIEAEFRQQVFEMFRRLHTQQEYPGTGIGLAICQRAIERHGGRIWVESPDGQGSVFHFTLPAADLEDDALSPRSLGGRSQG